MINANVCTQQRSLVHFESVCISSWFWSIRFKLIQLQYINSLKCYKTRTIVYGFLYKKCLIAWVYFTATISHIHLLHIPCLIACASAINVLIMYICYRDKTNVIITFTTISLVTYYSYCVLLFQNYLTIADCFHNVLWHDASRVWNKNTFIPVVNSFYHTNACESLRLVSRIWRFVIILDPKVIKYFHLRKKII